ncbi:MAG: rRNA maturation RNase YbeY [bacterium]
MEKDFSIIKNDILGKKYSLSVAYVDEKTSKFLNNKYRKINKPTNILSFSLRIDLGEIILCPTVIRKEAKNFGRTFEQFIGFLVIHGMLHLEGMEHGSTMEKKEEKYDQKYFCGNRCGIVHDSCRGRRVYKRRKIS